MRNEMQNTFWTRARPIVARAGFLALLLAGGGLTVLYAFQEAMLFPASRDVWRVPSDGPYQWQYDEVQLRVGAENTHGWFIPRENAAGVILFSHGNGGNIADRLEHYAMFRDLGYALFAYDYGGYGKSTGKPSEQRCYEDIRAAWKYLTITRGLSPDSIVLYGESLGGGVACDLAAEVKPRATILQSTFLSVTRRAQEIFPFLPVRWLLKHRFDSDSKIGRLNAPLLLIHSPEDTIVPFHHGRGLFDLAPEPKTFLELHGDHNECIYESEDEFRDGVRAFLDAL
ncbi:MAG: alpha/beta hydrolase [Candidatus Hydrogenedentes bacterium]|nr:alpha/beta hydrolase [Candidatus Hydrogenedentota bacterium]